ncbi:hypothetical protein [Achromobacter pestifer]
MFFLVQQPLQGSFLLGKRRNILSRPTEIPPLLDGLRALNYRVLAVDFSRYTHPTGHPLFSVGWV